MTSANGRAWMRITAYGDKWSVQQGDAIRFHVNCDGPSAYDAQLVKLIHGDTNPAGPGFKEVPVDAPFNGRHDGRKQVIHSGSHKLLAQQGEDEVEHAARRRLAHVALAHGEHGQAFTVVLDRKDVPPGGCQVTSRRRGGEGADRCIEAGGRRRRDQECTAGVEEHQRPGESVGRGDHQSLGRVGGGRKPDEAAALLNDLVRGGVRHANGPSRSGLPCRGGPA